MKKLQLKVPANKNRLQINRGKQDIFHAGESRCAPFKENLSNNGKIQQKEEKGSRRQLLPSVHAPAACLAAGTTNNKENQLQTRKKISASLQAVKPKEARRSASIDLSKNSEKTQNEQQGLSEAIKQLIKLFQHRKLRKNNGHSVGPSSIGLSAAIRNIIISQNISENSQITFTKNRLKDDTNHDSIFRKSRKSSFAGDVPNCSKKNLKICSKNVQITSGGADIGERKMGELRDQYTRLRVEKTGLEAMLQGLRKSIQEERRALKEIQLQKQSISQRILKGSAQLQEMKRFIEENGEILAKTEAKKFQIQTFVHSQPNKIVKQASQYHKNLQIDLFQFADYLRHHPLGKKQFQPSIYYGQIQRMMNIELQGMIDFLIQEKKQGEHQKCQDMLRFLEKLRHQYKLMNGELQKVIEQKTKYIEKYSSIMFLWYENYLTKKEYLNNLREGFSLEVVKIQEAKRKVNDMEKSGNCANCSGTKNQALKMMESVQKVVELFSLGNSFY